jgi:3-keto-5-aminohexanoate cleavage enzyme
MSVSSPLPPLVVTVCPTGMVPRRAKFRAVPEQPSEIAEDVRQAVAAGASAVHVHARDAQGEPVCGRERYAEVVGAIRAACPGLVVSVSTSGRVHKTFEERSDVLDLEGHLKPDLASLTLGSMNFPTKASVNEPVMIQRLADAMRERGIVPELEIFDFGMIDYAHYLMQKRVLQPPFVCNILLGSLGTAAATPINLALMVERLPAGTYWQAAGIGRFQWPMNSLGVVMGGHVRTGLEDNLYLDADKRIAATNVLLVSRVAQLALAAGRAIASPSEARGLMGLTVRDNPVAAAR